MKNKYLLIAPFFACLPAAAQINTFIMNTNDVNAMFADNGLFFTNPGAAYAACEIPKGEGNHPIYGAGFWASGTNQMGNVSTACSKYGAGNDFFAGPVSDDYDSDYYTDHFTSGIWKITREQINYHVANYTATGYTPDFAIANWPGNGDASEGVAEQLAPYVDVNDNGIYEPLLGDYPYIQGDAAIYIILNDEAGLHTETGSTPMGIELHAMFYQYQSADDVNNTTFLNVKVYNRRGATYNDFRLGLFLDTDIGNPMDDYIGSDSARSVAYGYNGDDLDQGGNGQPGYGDGPPAFGVKMLNEKAGGVMYYLNSGGPMGEPNIAPDYYNLMHSLWSNGSPLTDGTTNQKFAYNGNPYTNTGWTETSVGNAPGDRRMIIASKDKTLAPGGSVCFDFAFIYNRDTDDHLENVSELLTTADFIQNFYDTEIQPCNQMFLGGSKEQSLAISIYPNPSNGTFTIDSSEPVILSVFDLGGRVVTTNVQVNPAEVVNLELENGLYLFELRTSAGVSYQRVQILH